MYIGGHETIDVCVSENNAAGRPIASLKASFLPHWMLPVLIILLGPIMMIMMMLSMIMTWKNRNHLCSGLLAKSFQRQGKFINTTENAMKLLAIGDRCAWND